MDLATYNLLLASCFGAVGGLLAATVAALGERPPTTPVSVGRSLQSQRAAWFFGRLIVGGFGACLLTAWFADDPRARSLPFEKISVIQSVAGYAAPSVLAFAAKKLLDRFK